MSFQVEVKINKSRRKPVLLVYFHNRVLIEFPDKSQNTPENVAQIISSNKQWIEEKIKLNKTSTLEIYDKTYDFVSGTLIFIKGDRYQLKVIKVKKILEESVLIDGKILMCRVRKTDSVYIRESIKKFLYPKAEELIKDKVKLWASRIGVNYDKVFLKEYKSSWSHVRDNDLYFDWRIIFLSERLITYLVIHEVLHFIHRNHGNKFWYKLKALMADYRELEDSLKEQRYIVYRF